jgi:hypothetical protein
MSAPDPILLTGKIATFVLRHPTVSAGATGRRVPKLDESSAVPAALAKEDQ